MSTNGSEPPDQELDRLRRQTEHLVRRTTMLQRLTGRLSSALRVVDLAEIVIGEGTHALGATSGGLWRVDEPSQTLVLLRAHDYPPAALALIQSLPLAADTPVTIAARHAEPIWLGSRAEYERLFPVSAERTRGMVALAAYATAALPIILEGRVLGVLALTFNEDRNFEDDERAFLMLLAWHMALGFERARLYEAERTAREAAEIAHERAIFLSRASAVLGSSLDYEQTLANVASLAVPKMADWCGVELVVKDGPETTQVAVAHIDPSKVEYAHELRRRYPPDFNAATGIPHVIRTGTAELYAEIPDALLVASAIDKEHLKIMRALGLRSVMIVPIRDRNRTVGAVTFVIADSDRRYTHDDVLMATQLGERAGASIGKALLYDEANRAIRLRDEFLSIAGHELRTPLATLLLSLQSMVAAPDDFPIAKVRERAGKLVKQCDRLANLISELLDVGRISAGRIEIHREPLDLAILVRDIVQRMHDDAHRAGAPFELDLEPAVGSWDPARLDQILTNLFSNAVKYGKGSPITVRLRHTANTAVLEVTDHGIGIPPEDHARIFERFERAVSPRNFGGLGLGLWIVSQLTHAHGGMVTVKSAVGQGSTFTLTLPIADAHPA